MENKNEDIEYLSSINLNDLKDKASKFPDVQTDKDVTTALSCLCFYHCVRQSNIIYVVQEGLIKTKNNIMEGEFTNNQNDFYQGFDRHIAMSIGKPWLEYGADIFVYGIEHISDTALIYSADPWQMDRKQLSKSFLTKKDFIELASIIVKKKIVYKRGNFNKKEKLDSLELLNKSFERMELKNDKDLLVKDAVNYFSMTNFDHMVFLFLKFWWFSIIMSLLIASMFWVTILQ